MRNFERRAKGSEGIEEIEKNLKEFERLGMRG